MTEQEINKLFDEIRKGCILTAEEAEALLNFEEVDGWSIEDEGEYTQDYKYQSREVIIKNEATGKFYSVCQTRSGSPFTDWHYEDIEDVTVNDEVVKKEVVKYEWCSK